jgi:hypothetical protein
MGQAVPTQHPAAGAPVAIPSNHKLLRALLAFAAIAIVGLTVAVVILANDGEEVTGASSAVPSESIRYGGFNPATGRPHAAPMPHETGVLPARKLDGATDTPAPTSPLVSRYDGGPEEGTRGPGR